MFHHRGAHYGLLLLVWAVTSLPNLGGPLLWDIDEGLNATAAAEMLESGNYIVPTFNYQLRSAKPVLLYWLQCACYSVLGINEAAARLPSAIAVLLTTLLLYELGRWMFDRLTAVLGGLVLVSCISVQGAAHFANPDALLLLFFTATMASYWRAWQGHHGWIIAAGAAAALAVLAKGPVGLLLPGAVVVLFLLWQRQIHRLFSPLLAEGILVFLLLALPWYVWVSVETKGVWLREFWHTHHLQRAATPMENHSGSLYYYLIVLAVGYFPWAIFLGATLWYSIRWCLQKSSASSDQNHSPSALRLLISWLFVVLVFFSLMQTKLPNYILPMYPALALLTGRFLAQWLHGQLRVPVWLMPLSVVCLALTGIGIIIALMVLSGELSIGLPVKHVFPELREWAWLGAILILGACFAGWFVAVQKRVAFLTTISVTSVVFVAVVAGGALSALDSYKVNAPLARELPSDHLTQEVRIAALEYFKPSMVFYCRREVKKLEEMERVSNFLNRPLPSYLFVTERTWLAIQGLIPGQPQVLARRRDLYSGQHILLVGNQAASKPRTSARAEP